MREADSPTSLFRMLLPMLLPLVATPALLGCSGPVNNPYPASERNERILYAAYTEPPSHLDPARAYNSNEFTFIGQIYEPPLQYHYLKRPYQLAPLVAERLPTAKHYDHTGRELASGTVASRIARTVYEIHIRRGIRYQPHPAFARNTLGQAMYRPISGRALDSVETIPDFPAQGTREVTAADYAYQIKRLADPRLHSPIRSLMADYIIGFSQLAKQLAKLPNDDMEWTDLRAFHLSGAEVVDDHTLRIHLHGTYPQFAYWLAMSFFAPIPWEVDAFYHQPGMKERNLTLDAWPVGTGPFMMTANHPDWQIRLARNPNFRDEPYPLEGEPSDAAAGLLHDAGKTMPFLDGALFTLEKESIPLWSKFLQGYYDSSKIASDNFDQAIRSAPGGTPELSTDMLERGIALKTQIATSIWYVGFNMLDPIVGGYGESKRKLRHALAIALDMHEYLSIFMNGRGIPAQGPIPPRTPGHRSGMDGLNGHVYEWDRGRPVNKSIAFARRLLAESGYPNGRDAVTAKPLNLYLDIAARGPDDKARLDWFRKRLKMIGVELIVRSTDYNRFQEKMRDGHAQLFEWAWNADYPDAENFLFLFYGPNAKVSSGGENNANYRNPEFDTLFDQMKSMPDTPARQAIIDRMVVILQHDAPWVFGYHPSKYLLHHAWLANEKPNLMAWNTLKYLRVNTQLRNHSRSQWNPPTWGGPLVLGVVPLLAGTLVWLGYWQRQNRPAKITDRTKAGEA